MKRQCYLVIIDETIISWTHPLKQYKLEKYDASTKDGFQMSPRSRMGELIKEKEKRNSARHYNFLDSSATSPHLKHPLLDSKQI